MLRSCGGGTVYSCARSTTLFVRLWGKPLRRPFTSFSDHTSVGKDGDHILFINDVAATRSPEHLSTLLKMLQRRGDTILPPGDKQELIPLAIPLSKSKSGAVVGLLRWPTAPPGMEMPVVEVHKHGLWFLARNVNQYIHRLLVEEDAMKPLDSSRDLHGAASEAGMKIYKMGDFAESNLSNVDQYLLRKVGMFPDVLERKVMQSIEKEDHVSALVTAEFYAKKKHFPGFGRPIVFNAEILMKVGRDVEAKDAARGALKSPWWTLGYGYQKAALIAQCEDEQVDYIKKKLTKEGKWEDLNKGKDPTQIVLDEAAFLLDLASVEGTWDECVEQVAECYKEAGLHDIARFVLYKD